MNILVTGRPGIGKTTVVIGLAERLSDRTVAGFYTEEIRQGAHRQGFRAVTFSGRSMTLARVDLKGEPRVGRYGVNVSGFEKVILPELDRRCDLMLIDEIGKMECYSSRFVVAVQQALDGATPVVATVAGKGAGLIAEVKARPDVEIVEVTHANRDGLPDTLIGLLTSSD